MADNSWRNLESWERVKWARAQRFESASAAAEALGMKEGTYRCYERGPGSAKFKPLSYEYARKFARHFKVRWEWLLEGLGEPWLTAVADDEPTEKPPVNNLRAWREYAGYTAAELAKRAGTSAQVIADLESGAAELSAKWARSLADAIGTTEGRLLNLDPNEINPSVFDTFNAIPKEKREQALAILRTFRPAYQRKN